MPSRETFKTNPATQPTCLELDDIVKGINKYGQDTEAGPYPGPDPEVFRLVGIDHSHNGMFGDESDYNRAAVSNTDLVDLGLARASKGSTRQMNAPSSTPYWRASSACDPLTYPISARCWSAQCSADRR